MKIASTCLYVAIGTAMAFGASAQPHRVHNPDIHNVVPVPSEPAGCATEGTLAAGGPASAGDTCGAASAIANYNTATCDAIIDGYPGPEEVWELEVPGTIAADIVLTPAAADMAIALVSSCGVGWLCAGCCATSASAWWKPMCCSAGTTCSISPCPNSNNTGTAPLPTRI